MSKEKIDNVHTETNKGNESTILITVSRISKCDLP